MSAVVPGGSSRRQGSVDQQDKRAPGPVWENQRDGESASVWPFPSEWWEMVILLPRAAVVFCVYVEICGALWHNK